MDYFKIDDVSKLTGLTKRTIRYYEEIGVLPVPQRSKGRVRLYTQDDIDRLQKIINAKEVLGFSLKEIQDYLSINEVFESNKSVYRNTTDPQEQRDSLQQITNIIDEQLDMIDLKLLKIQTIKIELEQLRIKARQKIKQLDSQTK